MVLATEKVNLKALKKLHHYFGHTAPTRLLKLLANAGKNISGLEKPLEKVEASCEACLRTKKKKPKPKVAIPRADSPNSIVT